MKDKVMHEEAVSHAKSALAGDNLDDRFAELERDDEVDRALAELKARRA
jgi:phage shock protein A